MRKALETGLRPTESAPEATVSPAPALSEEDRAVHERVKAPSDAWLADRSCPYPPSIESFKAACDGGKEPIARRWLDLWNAWDEAGRPGAWKPPDFTILRLSSATFEERMEACEEGATDAGFVDEDAPADLAPRYAASG